MPQETLAFGAKAPMARKPSWNQGRESIAEERRPSDAFDGAMQRKNQLSESLGERAIARSQLSPGPRDKNRNIYKG